MYKYIDTYIHTFMDPFMYTYIIYKYTSANINTLIFTNVHIFTHIHIVYIYTYHHTCTHIFFYIYTYHHTCAHIFLHICIFQTSIFRDPPTQWSTSNFFFVFFYCGHSPPMTSSSASPILSICFGFERGVINL